MASSFFKICMVLLRHPIHHIRFEELQVVVLTLLLGTKSDIKKELISWVKSLNVNTMGIMAPIWNINFSSFTWFQIILPRWTVMLSYQSHNLEICFFCTILDTNLDSTLVPQIAIVRDWSKHRLRQRLWSVCMWWNQSDFDQLLEVQLSLTLSW